MSKIKEEAQGVVNGVLEPDRSDARQQAKRVLLLEKAYRYMRAAMKLRNYFENDGAWSLSNGVARGDDWYWFCIDCCEHNANILWAKAAGLYKQAEELQ